MIQTCLKDHIGKTIETYVDDVVAKTKDVGQLVKDLENIFTSLRVYHIKLNPEKCIFGVPARKLLGFIISHIEEPRPIQQRNEPSQLWPYLPN